MGKLFKILGFSPIFSQSREIGQARLLSMVVKNSVVFHKAHESLCVSNHISPKINNRTSQQFGYKFCPHEIGENKQCGVNFRGKVDNLMPV